MHKKINEDYAPKSTKKVVEINEVHVIKSTKKIMKNYAANTRKSAKKASKASQKWTKFSRAVRAKINEEIRANQRRRGYNGETGKSKEKSFENNSKTRNSTKITCANQRRNSCKSTNKTVKMKENNASKLFEKIIGETHQNHIKININTCTKIHALCN